MTEASHSGRPAQSLVVANSAFNLFVGLALAAAENGPVHLLAADRGASTRRWLDAIQNLGLFASTTTFRRDLEGRSSIGKFRSIARNVRLTRRLIDQLRPSQVLIGNDRVPTCQAAMTAAAAIGARQTYFDEGTNCYGLFPEPSSSALTRFVLRTIVGQGYVESATNGTRPGPHQRLRFFPDLVANDPLAASLPRGIFESDIFRHLVAACLDTTGVAAAIAAAGTRPRALVLPSHSESVTDRDCHTAFQASLRQRLTDCGYAVIAKRHPREQRTGSPGAHIDVEQSIPAEALLIDPRTRPRIVVGDLSTCLFFSRWLAPERRVYSTTQAVRDLTTPEQRLLDVLRIPSVKSPSEIA